MRINPVQNISFGAIKSTTKGVSKEILKEKEDIYNLISDEKGLDIWTFKRSKGSYMNPQSGYIVLIQNQKNGEVLKDIEGSYEDVQNINQRVEDALLWYDAGNNYIVAHSLKSSDVYKKHPKESDEIANKMTKISMSAEAGTWQSRLGLI